jgi:hypothetical protein
VHAQKRTAESGEAVAMMAAAPAPAMADSVMESSDGGGAGGNFADMGRPATGEATTATMNRMLIKRGSMDLQSKRGQAEVCECCRECMHVS